MLQSLFIRDFVIVDRLELELGKGFTVLTGETGAGKSILLDALSLAMGERADPSQIREGCSRAEISAQFFIEPILQEKINAWLDDNGFELEEKGASLQLKRVIDSGGRTKAFINGSTATLTQLRTVGDMLVDIHGQHAHQALLKPGAQRELLDRHAGHEELISTVAAKFKEWAHLKKQLKQAQSAGDNLVKERERLEWQLQELDALAPQEGEWEQIQTEHARLSNAAELINGTQALVALLSEDENALVDQLSKAESQLQSLAHIDPELQDALDALQPASIQVGEAAHSINRYLQKLDLDPERLEILEERLQATHRAAKKFHCSAEDLPTIWQELKEQLDALKVAQDIDALVKMVSGAQASYLQEAQKLSKKRATAAKSLEKSITEAMQDLAMAGGKFSIELQALEEGTQHGLEQIEFQVAGHPGVKPRAVSKVASGGELARISLAIAVITSAASFTPTLIFDEVDAGIGGAVASTVGSLLKQLGKSHQVLCVTHLAQVAALGDNQWRVRKSSENGSTLSHIDTLSRSERVDEIARMLGGASITETTLRHARELLES
jgi:DNA repair protein RecN (Recombination protein N)